MNTEYNLLFGIVLTLFTFVQQTFKTKCNEFYKRGEDGNDPRRAYYP